MAAGLPDLVDYALLAAERAVLRRVYTLEELPRLQDVLAAPVGTLNVSFAFATSATGAAGAAVTVEAAPRLVCQRCMQPFSLPVAAGSEVEFATADAAAAGTEREPYETHGGQVSLRDLAEEELLLALPLAPACDTPLTCGKAPAYATGGATPGAGEMRRPFSALQDLLKKT